MPADKRNIYAEVTDKMIDALSKGVIPWQKPWVGASNAPRNLQSGKAYRGVNALLLGLSGFSDPRWTTFKGAKKLDGSVNGGERGTLVTLWKRIDAKKNDPDSKPWLLLRHFTVFNVEQCTFPDGVVPALDDGPVEGFDPAAEAEAVMDGYFERPDAPSLNYVAGDRACYVPALHHVELPLREQFMEAGRFYSTAFHEAAHSTGHATMLKRDFSTFGSEPYAQEELIAEMTAAFIMAHVGIETAFDHSASYIKGWLKALRNDEKMVIQAAGKAQKAADLILGLIIEEAPSAEVVVPSEEAATVVA